MQEVKITAVVVTYNRLDLLKRCIDSLRKQNVEIEQIVVVDNSSTDGTVDYLMHKAQADNHISTLLLSHNEGGAGGFEKGVQTAVSGGCDYVWMMDDDTIPEHDALEKLLRVQEIDKSFGFAASRVIWKDGSIHLMNRPLVKGRGIDLNEIKEPHVAYAATFVSLLVPSSVIRKVGLPIGKFFIWHDDIEFTSRITRAGYHGYFMPGSCVLHATCCNRGSSIKDAPLGSEKRFYYQIRNYMATKRLRSNRIRSVISGLNKLYKLRREINKRIDHKKEFITEVKHGFKDGLSFNPEIHFID